MNKKIKVIELIKRIYENKDVPKKIKYKDIEFWYENALQDYCSMDDRCTYLFKKIIELPTKWLNVEVEILEDEDEIDIKMFEDEWLDEHKLNMQAFDLDLVLKINEVIDKVNKLDKKINKED